MVMKQPLENKPQFVLTCYFLILRSSYFVKKKQENIAEYRTSIQRETASKR